VKFEVLLGEGRTPPSRTMILRETLHKRSHGHTTTNQDIGVVRDGNGTVQRVVLLWGGRYATAHNDVVRDVASNCVNHTWLLYNTFLCVNSILYREQYI
jgi:hypothetical protein